jgi:hypothetical protein
MILERPILRALSLRVRRGEMLAINPMSGDSLFKTASLNCMSGIILGIENEKKENFVASLAMASRLS